MAGDVVFINMPSLKSYGEFPILVVRTRPATQKSRKKSEILKWVKG